MVWDWGYDKWEIWKFPKEGKGIPHHVLTVQTTGRTYRELGTDVLLKLQASRQLDESLTLSQLVAYFDEMDEQLLRRKRKAIQDKIAEITHETFEYIHILRGKPIANTPMSQTCPIFDVPKSVKVQRVITGE